MLKEKRPAARRPLLAADDRQAPMPIPFDRRQSKRSGAEGGIMAAFFSQDSGITLARVEVLDTSRNGMGLRSPLQFKPGTRFNLYREGLPLPGDRGTVARCADDKGHYLLGLRFDAGSAA